MVFGLFGPSALLFDEPSTGPNVSISASGLDAKRTVEDDLGGVVFLNQALSFSSNLAYFEVIVDDVTEGEEDGLTIGVTTEWPKEVPACADDVEMSWSCGYDGRAHVQQVSEMIPISWQPKSLRIGARVGFLVASDGAACVVVDGWKVANLPGLIPSADQVPLYAMVDLLGNTKACSLVSDAVIPRQLKGFCIQDVRDETMEVMYTVFAGNCPQKVHDIIVVTELLGIPSKVVASAKKAMYKGPDIGSIPAPKARAKNRWAINKGLRLLGFGKNRPFIESVPLVTVAPPLPKDDMGKYGDTKRLRKGWNSKGIGQVQNMMKLGMFKVKEEGADDDKSQNSVNSAATGATGVSSASGTASGNNGSRGKAKKKSVVAKKKAPAKPAEETASTASSDSTTLIKSMDDALLSLDADRIKSSLAEARSGGVAAAEIARVEKAFADMEANSAKTEKLKALADAVQTKDVGKIKAALDAARKSGIAAADLVGYETALQKLETVQKRLQEMQDAILSTDVDKMKAAVDAARSAGVDAAAIEAAEKSIQETNKAKHRGNMVANLSTALQSGEIDMLKAAISEARDAKVEAETIAKYEACVDKMGVELEKKIAMGKLGTAVASEDIDGIKAALEVAKEVQARAAKASSGIRASIRAVGRRLSLMVNSPDEIAEAETALKTLEQKREQAKVNLSAAVSKARGTNPPTVEVLKVLKEAMDDATLRGVDTQEAVTLHKSMCEKLAAAKKAAEDALMGCIAAKKPAEISSNLETCNLFGSEEVVQAALAKVAEIVQADMAVAFDAEREDKPALLPPIEALLNVYRKHDPGSVVLRKLHNDMQDLKGALRVFCRIRPLNKRELGLNDTICVQAAAGDMDVTVTSSRGESNLFSYDAIFVESNSQVDVFEECRSLIQSAFDGYNITIFTYGQTGAGKTWTLYGIPEQPGVSPRTCTEVFEVVNKGSDRFEYEISASMVELYNSMVRDLLSGEKSPPKLDIRQDKAEDGTMSVRIDATVVPAKNVGDLETAVAKGFGNRKVASTSMNADSSRSHLLFMIFAKIKEISTGKTRIGKITIVDLAGSERLAKSQVTGDAQKEAIEINKSLTALGDVMMAITSKAKMVPYRNHKLTQLMQDSLGGSAKTLMFVNISPATNNADETINALKYASRARCIENDVAKDKGNGSRPKGKAKGKAK